MGTCESLVRVMRGETLERGQTRPQPSGSSPALSSVRPAQRRGCETAHPRPSKGLGVPDGAEAGLGEQGGGPVLPHGRFDTN